VIRPLHNPLVEHGGVAVLWRNLCEAVETTTLYCWKGLPSVASISAVPQCVYTRPVVFKVAVAPIAFRSSSR
jgi:hypothetical protein